VIERREETDEQYSSGNLDNGRQKIDLYNILVFTKKENADIEK